MGRQAWKGLLQAGLERSDKHCGDASHRRRTRNCILHRDTCNKLEKIHDNNWILFDENVGKSNMSHGSSPSYLSTLSLFQVGKWVGGGRSIVGVLVGASKGRWGCKQPKPTVRFVSGLPWVWTRSDLPKWPHTIIGPLTGHNITLWPFLSGL